ncbi:hypothetical protein B0A55_06132 [Friedmanniomyces simplex]|uniref:CBS domain-containing protein n=1 Tax=Friedmanniomyces simplex TaxID=329884 RepID=A0A4U0X3J8_9PEZI|nr:hypothetical protein B0A55_06132 [Friedmanniomyces simplex]
MGKQIPRLADLDPPPALSTTPQTPIHAALLAAFERDYTHLTVLAPTTRTLLGYLSTPHLRALLASHTVSETDPVEKAMVRFKRRRRGGGEEGKGSGGYRVITLETPLEELDGFFAGEGTGEAQEFAVVTDPGRRCVLGVATKGDLEEFVRRRPA